MREREKERETGRQRHRENRAREKEKEKVDQKYFYSAITTMVSVDNRLKTYSTGR